VSRPSDGDLLIGAAPLPTLDTGEVAVALDLPAQPTATMSVETMSETETAAAEWLRPAAQSPAEAVALDSSRLPIAEASALGWQLAADAVASKR
jgi:hypothetical protein